MNPVTEQINRTADDPSVAVYLPIPLATTLIGLVGGGKDGSRWTFPDGFWMWDTGEALRYALEVLPDIVADFERVSA